jgi:hypothetical protein
MRNLFLSAAALLAITVNAQDEPTRGKTVVISCAFNQGGVDRSLIMWEVWKDPMYDGPHDPNCTDCDQTYYWKTPYDERVHYSFIYDPVIDDEFIAKSIKSNRAQTAKHDGQIIMTFEGNGFGIYHVYARNKETGELLGATAANIDNGFEQTNSRSLGINRNIKLGVGQKHCGVSIAGKDTYMYNCWTDEPYLGWEFE